MSRQNVITKRGLQKLLREIEWLQKVERPKITAEVSYAASLGDRSENAEYIYGKKRLREIDRRMRFLIGRLDHVVEVDPAAQEARANGTVIFGATVVIADEEGRERTFRMYGEDEVDVDRGILSWKSPIGRALMGKEEGDEVTYKAPGGERTVEVLEVRYDAQEPLPLGDLEAWKLPG